MPQRRRCGVACEFGAFRAHQLADRLFGGDPGMTRRARAHMVVDEPTLERADVAVDVRRDERID
jgi:hypothetical protein